MSTRGDYQQALEELYGMFEFDPGLGWTVPTSEGWALVSDELAEVIDQIGDLLYHGEEDGEGYSTEEEEG